MLVLNILKERRNNYETVSIDEYRKNPLRKIVTRDGRKVTIHCTDFGAVQPVVARIEGAIFSQLYYRNGKSYIGQDSQDDLFFAPEKKAVWLNIYKGCDGPITSYYAFSSKEEAEESSRHGCSFTEGMYRATVKAEWEE